MNDPIIFRTDKDLITFEKIENGIKYFLQYDVKTHRVMVFQKEKIKVTECDKCVYLKARTIDGKEIKVYECEECKKNTLY